MAEQLKDSLVSPTTTTAEAVIAGTTTDFDVSSAAGLPATGTFRLLLKGAADDGSDDALATVGSISGVNCASVTWLENGQTNFASGTEVELVLTAAGVDAAIDDRTALYLPLAGGTLTNPLLLPNGSAAAPALSFSSDTDIGVYRRGANQLGFSVAGAEAAYFTTIALNITGNVLAQGGLYSGVTDSGSSLTISGTTPTNIEITAANATLTLPQVAWGSSTTPVFRISDPLQLIDAGNPLTIVLWAAGVSFNSLNEGDTTYGIWDDQAGGFGPGSVDGTLQLTDTGAVYQLVRQRNDPGISGAIGGWHMVKISNGLYT